MKNKKEEAEKVRRLSHFTINGITDAIFWIDSEAQIYCVNEAASRSLGYRSEELRSMKVHDIDPNHQPDNWRRHWAELRKRRSLTFESRHRTKDGRILPVEVTSNYIQFEGQEYSCSIARDITQRLEAERTMRESEKRFKDIFGAVNDGILIIDADETRIVEVNQKAVELLAYEKSELIGMHIERIHPQELDQLTRTLKEVVLGRPVQTDEFSCLRKDKQRMPAEISFSPVRLNAKTHVMAMVRDVTERKQAEEALRSALGEVERLKDRLQQENVYLQEEIKVEHNFEEIITGSHLLQKVLRKVEQVAATDATVLILGETGTGKELFTRAVHNVSTRRDRPLVKVNCAALPATLIESELFGHEKGAFTGALARKVGRFELADGGTIFLDEIGDLPLGLQVKLLRVLQEGEFERLGNPKTFRVDARVIAATNRNLEKAIENGEFREDLYYRLNVFPIEIPPLRARKEDVPLLLNHFLVKYGTKLGKKIESIPRAVTERLQAYDWPGNVRELENTIERAVIISQGKQLQLGDWLPRKGMSSGKSGFATLEELETQHITEALEATSWRVSGENGAAKILGLKPTTLEARMKKLGIKRMR